MIILFRDIFVVFSPDILLKVFGMRNIEYDWGDWGHWGNKSHF
jgi:hypothetical protein